MAEIHKPPVRSLVNLFEPMTREQLGSKVIDRISLHVKEYASHNFIHNDRAKKIDTKEKLLNMILFESDYNIPDMINEINQMSCLYYSSYDKNRDWSEEDLKIDLDNLNFEYIKSSMVNIMIPIIHALNNKSNWKNVIEMMKANIDFIPDTKRNKDEIISECVNRIIKKTKNEELKETYKEFIDKYYESQYKYFNNPEFDLIDCFWDGNKLPMVKIGNYFVDNVEEKLEKIYNNAIKSERVDIKDNFKYTNEESLLSKYKNDVGINLNDLYLTGFTFEGNEIGVKFYNSTVYISLIRIISLIKILDLFLNIKKSMFNDSILASYIIENVDDDYMKLCDCYDESLLVKANIAYLSDQLLNIIYYKFEYLFYFDENNLIDYNDENRFIFKNLYLHMGYHENNSTPIKEMILKSEEKIKDPDSFKTVKEKALTNLLKLNIEILEDVDYCFNEILKKVN